MQDEAIELSEKTDSPKEVSPINGISTSTCVNSLEEKSRIESGTIDLRFNLHDKYGNETGRKGMVN